MQQRQLRLGDILDDYCPRERRVTNHAVVAMLGSDVKQTRCTTCDAEHEYKQAKVPRQRRKNESPAALYAQVAANAPKRVAHAEMSVPDDTAVEAATLESDGTAEPESPVAEEPIVEPSGGVAEVLSADHNDENENEREEDGQEEGPVHRPLIRASLPRPEGQQPPARPIPEFTIRQPTGRQNRFRPRGPRGQQQGGGYGFQGGGGNRGNGNFGGPPRGVRPGGRPPHGGGGPMTSHLSRRNGPGRKRSK